MYIVCAAAVANLCCWSSPSTMFDHLFVVFHCVGHASWPMSFWTFSGVPLISCRRARITDAMCPVLIFGDLNSDLHAFMASAFTHRTISPVWAQHLIMLSEHLHYFFPFLYIFMEFLCNSYPSSSSVYFLPHWLPPIGPSFTYWTACVLSSMLRPMESSWCLQISLSGSSSTGDLLSLSRHLHSFKNEFSCYFLILKLSFSHFLGKIVYWYFIMCFINICTIIF